MATTLQDGDRVQIADREATADDAKSGMFFNFFRGATGTIQKVYSTEEVAVELDLESVSEPISTRHLEVQEAMKAKWLDGLSEEARGRLSEAEKAFRLHYSILVAPADLLPSGPRAALPVVEAAAAEDSTTAARTTLQDIEAAEIAELERRRNEAAQ